MDARIRDTIERVEECIASKDDALAIPRVAAEFMYTLLLASRTRRCLEIGTSYGYSGLWIAAALEQNDGLLVTIDKEQRKSDVASAYFADAGLAERVHVEVGLAQDVIARLEGPFDFVFVDADKDTCIQYVEALEPKLASRAIVLTDNTETHAAELDGFVKWIRNHDGFVSADLPIGNGMELSVRIDGAEA